MPSGFRERLATLCAIDSPTGDLAGLARSADLLVTWAREDGLEADLHNSSAGPVVVFRTVGNGANRTLLIGHHDTVYPGGTGSARPVVERDGRLTGPGVADMKGGLLVGLAAMACLAADSTAQHGSVELWCLPDEEARSVEPSCLEDWRGASAAICLECGRADGSIVTTRKACTWLTIKAVGRDAHAGTARSTGRSALMALAREALRVEHDLHDTRPGIQTTITHLHAGSGKNTVPGTAIATVDLRAATTEDLIWAIEQVGRFDTYDGVSFQLSKDHGFPPLTRADALADRALDLLREVGAPACEAMTAGASDGSWASSIGVPTIDGLGPIGGGDHSPDEWIDPFSVAPRIEVVRRLCLQG